MIGASPPEQERLAAIAEGFSEEDLTRYLRLTLDMFTDLQTSLQPRLHLEVGLLRLVHAGRLAAIEDVLANVAQGSLPASGPKPKATAQTAKPSAPPKENTRLESGATPDLRTKLHAKLVELGLNFTADAVEHSTMLDNNGELRFVTPEEFSPSMNEKDIQKALQQVAGRPMRVHVQFGQPQVASAPIEKKLDDVSERALSHPDVRRFQELFPDAQVRAVRNLKE